MRNKLFNQVYASIGTTCLFFSYGYIIGLMAVIVPNLRNTSIKLTEDEESWIPSIMFLMMFPSQFMSGLLTARFGRKYLILVSLIPGIVSCIILFWAKTFLAFFAAYLISGLVGGGFAIGPMLVAEVCSPKHRGVLLNARTVSMSVGTGLAHLLGNVFDWRSVILLGTIPGLIGSITTITSPESPAWYAYREMYNECKTAFIWYRGDNDCKELKQLLNYHLTTTKYSFVTSENKSLLTICRNNISAFLDKAFVKAVFINISIVIYIEASGKQIFLTYFFDIINEIVKNENNNYYYALFIDVADTISVFVSCFMVRTLKRRSLLFGTGIPAFIILLITCGVCYLTSKNILPANYSWITILLFSLYFLMLNIGVSPVMLTLLGEIYPLSHKGVGVAISSFVFVSIMFIVTKISPTIIKFCGIHGTFLINAVITSLALLHLYFVVPETSNITLQDIENKLKSTVNVCDDEKADLEVKAYLLDSVKLSPPIKTSEATFEC